MALFDQPNQSTVQPPNPSVGGKPPSLPPILAPTTAAPLQSPQDMFASPAPPPSSFPPPPPVPGVKPFLVKTATREPEDIFSKTAPLGRDNGTIPRTPNPMASIAESPALGIGRKLTRLVFFAIGAIIIIGGAYALYIYVIAPSLVNKTPVNTNNNVPAVNENDNVNIPINENNNAPVNQNENTNQPAIINTNENINANTPAPFLPAVDTDGDGLTDDAETNVYLTDPNKADTDGDGLSDRDEIVTWKTDPLKADTDGDGYADGVEVKGGYNPLGPGKLLPPVIK